ncbi:unnamed protein product [Nesidiocoris tenuis]|uniref:Uncharacterized protein n=1 Tax=Nesidiocoris tenuis TaxID=355587 RepID=A0A6H5GFQ1_9HEMI|nr:unnamed protein product [Nesidiocoris tenuis]
MFFELLLQGESAGFDCEKYILGQDFNLTYFPPRPSRTSQVRVLPKSEIFDLISFEGSMSVFAAVEGEVQTGPVPRYP